HGAMLCASLMVTLGALNAFILRLGMMRLLVGNIVLLWSVSDMLLIGAGVCGASVLVARSRAFLHDLLYLGIAYLSWLVLSALR
ncbi:amino acid transporter, partial [Burkholderia pseudomallei]